MEQSFPIDMKSFYGRYIHSHIYNDYDLMYKKYYSRIEREFSLVDINLENLKDKVIIDVGTGAQSIVFSRIKCKQIYHYDINNDQVQALKKYIDSHGILNIQSKNIDITQTNCLFPEFDYAVIIGVYHHLITPSSMLNNLLKSGKVGSKIFIRCYRSGTWSRWLVSKIREVNNLTNIESLTKIFNTLYPLGGNTQFLSDMVDDFFVPVWGAYNPKQLISMAKKLGLSSYTPDNKFDFDFSSNDESFRIIFEKVEPYNESLFSENLLLDNPIDQSELDIEFLDMKYFSNLWRKYKDRLELMTTNEVSLRLIILYQLARKMNNVYDLYSLSKYTHENINSSSISESRIKALYSILEK